MHPRLQPYASECAAPLHQRLHPPEAATTQMLQPTRGCTHHTRQAWKWLEGEARDTNLESAAVRTGAAFQAKIPPFAPRRAEECEDRADELQVIDFTPCAAPPPLPPHRADTPSPELSLGYHGDVGQGGRARRRSHEERSSPPSLEEEERAGRGRRFSSQFRGVSLRHGRWKARSYYATVTTQCT